MPVDPKKVQELFLAAVECTDLDERVAILERQCGEDLELRARVEALLKAHDEPENLPQARLAQGDATVIYSPAYPPGTLIAERYKLLEQIAEGGMGVVWIAQQTKPVRRRVALKLIKPGMDSRQVLSRFEVERQALALMDHPYIAKVLDGGMTDQGRPFFVMEYVKGVPITEYCDKARLTVHERLKLFVQVCQAVQHAHQKGVIHRDLKPSNILVCLYDGQPVPKVIDFGLAKAINQPLTENTLFTAHGLMVGTPLYMSPEQAEFNNLDIDTRTDVYSLGVILYELMTGTTPLEKKQFKDAALQEILRLIKEEEPIKPSTKLSGSVSLPDVAVQRRLEPAQLGRALRGDLDWIVMKSLEKERSRRYETATGLARDVERYLHDQPVEASPPSASYRFRKFARRNRTVMTTSAIILSILVLGIVASVTQAVRATRAEKAIAASLEELRATAPAFVEQARAMAAKEHFGEAIEKLDYALTLRPDAAEYLVAKGDLLQCQLKLNEAAAAYRAALKLKPDLTRAEESAVLCEDLLAAKPTEQGTLTRESLAKLHLIMQNQQRPAAELMLVARLLGEEKKLIVAYWLERLKVLPISAEKPLDKRLTVRDDGLLALDLSNTRITDLASLAGAPLAVLDASGASELTSIAPLRGMKLIELNLASTKIADLSPLEKMHTLEKISLNSTPVADLSPLQGLRLRSVDITGCPITSISALRTAALKEFSLGGTRVTDLSPLMGMPLTFLDMGAVPVIDFTPLSGLPLEICNFPGCQLTDLAVLRGTPLRELMLWNCSSARNYAVLNEITTLELLILPATYRRLPEKELTAIDSLRHHPTLRQLGSENRNGLDHTTTRSRESFFQDWDRENLPLAAFRKSGLTPRRLERMADGTWEIDLSQSELSDLTILRDVPISLLFIHETHVSDLEPLRGKAIRDLHLYKTKVVDLSPLEGMPLEVLNLVDTRVKDLSALRGMPLSRLSMDFCNNLHDLSPLADIKTLRYISLPPNPRNVECLRALPQLERLSYREDPDNNYLPDKTAVEFWQEYDEKNKSSGAIQ